MIVHPILASLTTLGCGRCRGGYFQAACDSHHKLKEEEEEKEEEQEAAACCVRNAEAAPPGAQPNTAVFLAILTVSGHLCFTLEGGVALSPRPLPRRRRLTRPMRVDQSVTAHLILSQWLGNQIQFKVHIKGLKCCLARVSDVM